MSNKIKRYPFLSKSSFIGGWILPEKVTDNLVNTFNLNVDQLQPGGSNSDNELTGNAVDKTVKDSLEMGIDPFNFESPFGEYRKYLQLYLQDYFKTYEYANLVKRFDILESYNYQYYKPGGGFKVWHMENNLGVLSIHRHLVFMTYLNDVPDGGTEFLYQKTTTPAKKGLTLIWPSIWTHTHRGQISKTQEKIIITGWYNGVDAIDLVRQINE